MKLVNIGCGHNYNKDWINLDLYKSPFVKYHDIKNKLPFPDKSVDVIYNSHVLEHLNKKEAKKFIDDCYRVLKNNGIIRVVVPDLEQICVEYLKNLDNAFNSNNKIILNRYKWNKIEIFDQILRRKVGGEMLAILNSGDFEEDYIKLRSGEEFYDLLKSIKNSDKRNGLKNKIINFIKSDNILSNFLRTFIKKANPQKSGEAHKWMYDRLDLRLLLEGSGFKSFKIVKYDESNIPNWNSFCLDKSKNSDNPRKPDSLFVEAIK